MQPTQKVGDFPHAAFELSAFDCTSSPPRDQIAKGMAEREGLGGVSPKVFAEIKDAQPEVSSAISLKDYIISAVEAASGDFKGLAIEHKEFFDKTIRESDDLAKEEHDKVMEKLSFLENNMNAQFTALSAKLDVVIEFTKVNIKVTRVEGEKKGGPMAAADREAIEIAAYKKGFDKAQADGIKARKSIVTQLGNLRKAYNELQQHGPPDEDIEEYEEGAAETAEEQRERKEKAKEQERLSKQEAREERQDGEWDQRPYGQPRPPLPGIQIPARKRARSMAGPVKPVASSSSSSSSSAGAAPAPMPMPPAHHRVKVFCDDCQAPKEEECVCAKE
jgi:hypothetical protein